MNAEITSGVPCSPCSSSETSGFSSVTSPTDDACTQMLRSRAARQPETEAHREVASSGREHEPIENPRRGEDAAKQIRAVEQNAHRRFPTALLGAAGCAFYRAIRFWRGRVGIGPPARGGRRARDVVAVPLRDEVAAHRAADEESLRHLAAEAAQYEEGLGVVDAFGDDAHVERVRELDDRLRDLLVLPVDRNRADEAPVDLDLGRRDLLQVRKRRVALPEVVDREIDAELADTLEARERGAVALHQAVLGNLDRQAEASSSSADFSFFSLGKKS